MMKRFYDMFNTLHARIHKMLLTLWRKRPRRVGQSPPFRRARISMGMTLETASLSLTLPIETIENIECGRYRSTGLHPDFLIHVIKDYGALLNVDLEDIEDQIYTIRCAEDARAPLLGRTLHLPIYRPWRTQLAMLVTSVVLSYTVFMGGWGLFCERECSCMALSHLNTLPSIMPEEAPVKSITLSPTRGQKCSIHGGCGHGDQEASTMLTISDEALAIVQAHKNPTSHKVPKKADSMMTAAPPKKAIVTPKPARQKPAQMKLDDLLSKSYSHKSEVVENKKESNALIPNHNP